MNNRERAARAGEAYLAVNHDDNDALTNISDLMANLCHFADQFQEFEIIHAYTDSVCDNVVAAGPESALAQYAIDRGYGDPREESEPVESPFFRTRDGKYYMAIENYEVYARRVGPEDGWGLSMLDRARMHYEEERREEEQEVVTATELTDEQRIFLCDLISHDSDLIGDLVGYADEAGGDIDEDGWFQNLLNSTREALGTSREPKQHRTPTMTAAHQRMADEVKQALEHVQDAIANISALDVNVEHDEGQGGPHYSTNNALHHLKEAETILENA